VGTGKAIPFLGEMQLSPVACAGNVVWDCKNNSLAALAT